MSRIKRNNELEEDEKENISGDEYEADLLGDSTAEEIEEFYQGLLD